MNEPLFLFVGKSSSGKTTIANILEQKHGFKQVNSYTTRPQRYDGEIGHMFVTENEFKSLGDMIAYTFYNGNHYGTTQEQLDQCSIYVVDIPGVEALLQKYHSDRPIVIIYFDTNVFTRINRMIDRGDSDVMIVSRLLQDEKSDWFYQLDSIVWKYTHILGRDVKLHFMNSNGDLTSVLTMVKYYMGVVV